MCTKWCIKSPKTVELLFITIFIKYVFYKLIFGNVLSDFFIFYALFVVDWLQTSQCESV